MKKQYRILKNTEFQKIKNTSEFDKGEFTVIYFKKKKLEYSRIGISVSKAIGNAVVRNKIKRQIRSIFTMNNDFEKLKNDYVVFPRKTYPPNKFLKIEKEILSIINKREN